MDVESSVTPSALPGAKLPSQETALRSYLHAPRDRELTAVPGSWLGLPMIWPRTAQERLGQPHAPGGLRSSAEQLGSFQMSLAGGLMGVTAVQAGVLQRQGNGGHSAMYMQTIRYSLNKHWFKSCRVVGLGLGVQQ